MRRDDLKAPVNLLLSRYRLDQDKPEPEHKDTEKETDCIIKKINKIIIAPPVSITRGGNGKVFLSGRIPTLHKVGNGRVHACFFSNVIYSHFLLTNN